MYATVVRDVLCMTNLGEQFLDFLLSRQVDLSALAEVVDAGRPANAITTSEPDEYTETVGISATVCNECMTSVRQYLAGTKGRLRYLLSFHDVCYVIV